jgi:electron transfer flavoprotein alpha subunit
MAKMLVIAETDGQKVLESSRPAVTFAQKMATLTNGSFDILAIGGPGIGESVQTWSGYGAGQIHVAEASDMEQPTANLVAAVCVQVLQSSGADSVAAASSAFSRDVLPRLAGLLDLPMLSDVMGVAQEDGGLVFKRPMYAGNIIATVQIEGEGGVYSVRGTAFDNPETSGTQSVIETVQVDSNFLPQGTTFISLEGGEQKRPDLAAARVVVSGGRPLRDAETFERLVGGLADKLGGAVGATRAAVDSGIAPNELQIGQTGRVVAPDLYIAAGISGSVQHLAGMKESKTIVAINTDPDAPIFEVADYGLVADLHQALPELISKL